MIKITKILLIFFQKKLNHIGILNISVLQVMDKNKYTNIFWVEIKSNFVFCPCNSQYSSQETECSWVL